MENNRKKYPLIKYFKMKKEFWLFFRGSSKNRSKRSSTRSTRAQVDQLGRRCYQLHGERGADAANSGTRISFF